MKNRLYTRLILLVLLSSVCMIGLSQKQPYAPYGEVFTPRGDLRVLVVCVGFEGEDFDQPFSNWPPHQDLPDYMNDGQFFDAFYQNFDQFDQFRNDTSVKNISKLYHEMSQPNESFRIIADVFPRRINISAKGANRFSCWSLFNQRAIRKLKEEEPEFDWSPYDNRKNRPNFLFDNSMTGPDGKPDFIIFYYRYNANWKKELFPSAKGCAGDGGGGSSLWGIRNFEFGDFVIGNDGFFVTSSATKSPEGFMKLFKHELGHELFSGPHYMGANSAIGRYFNLPIAGWGSTVTTELLNNTINSWERWLLGWSDITHDLADTSDNGIYKIRDFASTGDAIRIKIPNTKDEYLWIENHQQESVFDVSSWEGKLRNKPEGSSGIAGPEKGIYMFTESMVADREAISTGLVNDMNAVNGAFPLNAQGNFDYTFPSEYTKTNDWSEYWNGKMYHFTRTHANPYGGLNPYLQYRADFDGNGTILNKGNFNGAKTESVKIVKEYIGGDLKLIYGNHGGRNQEALPFRRSDAFQVGDKLNMSTNPAPFHRPRFDKTSDRQRPIYLNGLDIEILSRDSNGAISISVKFNNNRIKNDLRICGNVTCKPIKGAPNDIDYLIAEGIEVVINKSGIPNHLLKDSLGFIHPTSVKIDDSVHVSFSKKSRLSISDKSSVILEPGTETQFTKRVMVKLDNQSELVIRAGAIIDFHRTSRIVVTSQSTIRLEAGAEINGHSIDKTMILKDTKKYNPRKLRRLLK